MSLSFTPARMHAAPVSIGAVKPCAGTLSTTTITTGTGTTGSGRGVVRR